MTDTEIEKYGKPVNFDPSFKGPIEDRSCTDILCLFLFVVFIIGWLVLGGFAYKYGDPDILIHPTDSQGNVCGRGNFLNKPNLFFFDLIKCAKFSSAISGCPTPQVCVESCPNKTFSVHVEMTKSNFIEKDLKKELICKYDVDVNTKSVSNLIKDEDCAAYYLQSESLIGRCIPKIIKQIGGKLSDINNTVLLNEEGNPLDKERMESAYKNLARFNNAKAFGMKIFQDLKSVWKSMLVGLLISLGVAFLWILLMRWLAGFMVILSILIVLGLLGYLSYYCFQRYKGPEKIESVTDIFSENLDTRSTNTKTWLSLGIISAVILGILLLLLIFLRTRICIAIALIKEGSRAVGCMMSSLIFPLLPYIFHLLVFIYWGSIAMFLAASGRKEYATVDSTNKTISCDPNDKKFGDQQCRFVQYVSTHITYGQIYNLFAMLWATFFVMGFGQMSLAGAFASYYWTFNKPDDVPTFAVANGLCRTARYHLGSIAFGALLIAIVRFIRMLLEYIENKCKKYDNQFTKIVICCCKCCFWCLEKFIKFINKNAYIMVAIYGKNFCTSAKDAFSLLMRNIVRVVVLDKVTDFLLLIGKLVVVGATAAVSFYFFSGKVALFGHRVEELNYYIIPVLIVTLGSYIIATAFFNVYSMGVDTLFLCFLEDCERNDGSADRPYYMSKQLMKILGKQNVQEPE